MGSLMAGWDSPVLDPKKVAYRRNSSLTKEEIEAYWRTKKSTEEEHLRAISFPPYSNQENTFGDSEKRFERSKSAPSSAVKEDFPDMDSEMSLEKIIKKNGWWTRSNWAFLNEPPVEEDASKSYTPQFHVASLASSQSRAGDAIST